MSNQMESVVYYEDPEHGVVLSRADVVGAGRLEKILAIHPGAETEYCISKRIGGSELHLLCACNKRLAMMKSLISDTNLEYWKERKLLLTDVAQKVLIDIAPDSEMYLKSYRLGNQSTPEPLNS